MLKISTKEGLLRVNPDVYVDEDVPPEEILNWLGLLGGWWEYSKDPKRPHVILTSGLHSDGFANWWELLSYPHLCQIVANQLVRKLKSAGLERVDWVIGSAYAAIDFSKDVAAILHARHGIAEKGEGKMLWNRLTIQKGEVVLQAEELITTLGTLENVRQAIREGNAVQPVEFALMVGVLFNRSGQKEFQGFSIISLIEKDIQNWRPEVCPLCKLGSKVIKPKQNWAQLTGKEF